MPDTKLVEKQFSNATGKTRLVGQKPQESPNKGFCIHLNSADGAAGIM